MKIRKAKVVEYPPFCEVCANYKKKSSKEGICNGTHSELLHSNEGRIVLAHHEVCEGFYHHGRCPF